MSGPNTILIFSDWYIPGYRAGGPVQSVYNLAVLLSKNFRVRIVTTIYDLNTSDPYPDISANEWINMDPGYEVLYLDKSSIKAKIIKQLIKENRDSILYINGLFSLYFSILPAFYALLQKHQQVFVAVRGMLHRSALSVKPFKKHVFLSLARNLGLYQSFTLLAASQHEKDEILRVFGKVKVDIVPNIPLKVNEYYNEKVFEKNALKLLFLGRISPEKNPIALLEALSGAQWGCSLTFCGSASEGPYFADFMKKLESLPSSIRARYISQLPHQEVPKLLDESDLMILPSLGENFGHAVFESFACGVPVIIGNNTPWTHIEDRKAGIEVNPESREELLAAIEKFRAMDQAEYDSWRKGAFETAKDYYRQNNFEEIYIRLFS